MQKREQQAEVDKLAAALEKLEAEKNQQNIPNADVSSSSAPSAPSVALTYEEKVNLLRNGIDESISLIKNAAASEILSPSEKDDLNKALSALNAGGKKKISYAFETLDSNADAGVDNGKATIRIDPTQSGFFDVDGNLNHLKLANILVHEGRHIYDSYAFGSPMSQQASRDTERNAYRTQAAFLEVTGHKVWIADFKGNSILLNKNTADIAAENSVKSWVKGWNESLPTTNAGINERNMKVSEQNRMVDEHNKKHNTAVPYRNTIQPNFKPEEYKLPLDLQER